MKESVVRVILGLFLVICIAIIIILACIYGTRLNCEDVDEENEKFRKEKIPTMTHFPLIANTGLIPLNDTYGARAFMKTIGYSKVPGKEMEASVLRVDPTWPLKFTQLYEAIVVVLSGRVRITDSSAQTFNAAAGDSMYIPRGTKVEYRATERSFIYFVTQPAALRMFTEIQKAIDTNRAAKIKRAVNFNIAKPTLHRFDKVSFSYLNDTLFSFVKGAELTGGLYKLLKGPALEYTYEYEEFKYIVEGEFHLRDGTGKFVKAKAGDLMYFPKGTYVHFTSPSSALGFFVGQRLGGTA